MINKPLCCIIDDEESSLASLKDIIEEIDLLEVEQSFLDPDKFLIKVDKLQSKIIFLDMEMPITGLEVANKLKNKLIIFVSGHTDKAYQTYDVDAIDFVPKPIRASRVKIAIEKALKLVSTTTISLSTENASKEEILVSEIAFISTCKKEKSEDPRDKKIQLTNGIIIKVKNTHLKSLLEMLPNCFIQINKSEIINIDAVHKRINSDTVEIEISGKPFVFILGDKAKKQFFELKPNLS